MRRLRRQLSIVFQDPYAALNPRMSVRQILAEPFAIHHEAPPQGLERRLHELLAEVGLDPSALRRYPHEFSGGQRQRINIARAIALRPELLVLDEPVSALDVSVGAQVINLLRDLQQRYGLTYLFISHSMPLVRYLCHRVAVMQHGRIVETGTWSEVCDSPREPYTQQLLAATPELPALELVALELGSRALLPRLHIAHIAQIIPRVQPRLVPIVPLEPHRIISHRRHLHRPRRRLIHRQQRSQASASQPPAPAPPSRAPHGTSRKGTPHAATQSSTSSV